VRQNWANNVTFGARRFHEPSTLTELQALIASSVRARVIGTGHSFNDIADTDGDLISVAGLPARVEIDPVAMTVKVSAGMRYGELAQRLQAAGFALHNLGSLPHLSVAGAVATATHGSGNGNGNLATAVSSLDIVTADGAVRQTGQAVHLGALGIVTAVTLRIEPTYDVSQYVYEGLTGPWDEIFAAAYSVSVFTRWDGQYQGWVKDRDGWLAPQNWMGASLADGPRHPIPGISAEACTEQGGVAGPWHERLPHFRLSHTPSSGAELQSEFFVPRARASEAIAAVAGIGDLIRPVLQISELRTVAADEFWLSPAYQRDCLAIHFTWVEDAARVWPAVAAVEGVLAPFDFRPHWGKLFTAGPLPYPKKANFVALMHDFDPKGKLRNAFLDTMLAA
jgi:xylitol oxidase